MYVHRIHRRSWIRILLYCVCMYSISISNDADPVIRNTKNESVQYTVHCVLCTYCTAEANFLYFFCLLSCQQESQFPNKFVYFFYFKESLAVIYYLYFNVGVQCVPFSRVAYLCSYQTQKPLQFTTTGSLGSLLKTIVTNTETLAQFHFVAVL